ncbi:MAG TPA: 4-hydroxy-tetrahydrodipicolinate synthase [candidate division WOR-3 bacterium]|uniref:4-hydroxy-tetrahydrodipicolinate synthase n=1 Tax=candidate division WOR-3 bacterium TaxID=2052148 RepID=A0A7V0XG01_UNCW3|nr:4-hydroxy-tetrahydrodipicolinate synthase [candidate division WOR-3 bacterium]
MSRNFADAVPDGCTTALVTPFRKSRLDSAGLSRNVRFQLQGGVSGLLAAGSTGEAAALSEAEYERVVTTVVRAAKGRAKVMAGVGTSNTAKSLVLLCRARALGADSALVVAPYYVKPTQEGLYRHFRALAEAADLPLVVYNIPGRSAVNILPATIERLVRDCPNVAAVKEASGNVDQVTDIVSRCGDRVKVLSGDDSLTLPMMAAGARGVVSVTSNVAPADVSRMVERFLAGDLVEARRLHLALFPLTKALFVESNPIPVKAVLAMLGMAAGEPRLPLTPLSPEGRKVVLAALRRHRHGAKR